MNVRNNSSLNTLPLEVDTQKVYLDAFRFFLNILDYPVDPYSAAVSD